MSYLVLNVVDEGRKICRDYSEEKNDVINFFVSKLQIENETFGYKRILKRIKKSDIQNIILDDRIQNFLKLKEILRENDKYVVTGRRMSKVLIPRVIRKILRISNYPMHKIRVLLLMNEYSIENLDLIKCISKDILLLSVVSKNYAKFERTANNLYENYGYVVKLYDLEYDDAKHYNIIVNLDFDDELFKKLNINTNSIVISFNEKVDISKRSFSGIVIHDLSLSGDGIPISGFRDLAVCEAKVYRALNTISKNDLEFENQRYRIKCFIGNNGTILDEEIIKIVKNFT